MFHRVYASVPGADEEFEARKKKFCEENGKEEKDITKEELDKLGEDLFKIPVTEIPQRLPEMMKVMWAQDRAGSYYFQKLAEQQQAELETLKGQHDIACSDRDKLQTLTQDLRQYAPFELELTIPNHQSHRRSELTENEVIELVSHFQANPGIYSAIVVFNNGAETDYFELVMEESEEEFVPSSDSE